MCVDDVREVFMFGKPHKGVPVFVIHGGVAGLVHQHVQTLCRVRHLHGGHIAHAPRHGGDLSADHVVKSHKTLGQKRKVRARIVRSIDNLGGQGSVRGNGEIRRLNPVFMGADRGRQNGK